MIFLINFHKFQSIICNKCSATSINSANSQKRSTTNITQIHIHTYIVINPHTQIYKHLIQFKAKVRQKKNRKKENTKLKMNQVDRVRAKVRARVRKRKIQNRNNVMELSQATVTIITMISNNNDDDGKDDDNNRKMNIKDNRNITKK